MARLVPARIKAFDELSAALLSALDSQVDDAHVAFQPKQDISPFIVIAHPDKPMILVRVVGEPFSYDPDAESFVTASGEEVDVEANKIELLKRLALSDAQSAAVQGYILCPQGSYSGQDNELIVHDIGSLIEKVQLASASSTERCLSAQAIDRIIELMSPGASGYTPGFIPKAQEKWRAEKAEEPSAAPRVSMLEAQEPPETEDATTAEEGKETAEAAPEDEEPKEEDEAPGEDEESFPPAIMKMLASCVEATIGETEAYAMGVSVTPEDITNPQFLLPALLLAVSDHWAPVVSSKQGLGGFSFSMKEDEDTLLGYRVTSLSCSSPILFFTPLVNFIRHCKVKEEFVFNGMVESFLRWLDTYEFNNEIAEDVQIRIVIASS